MRKSILKKIVAVFLPVAMVTSLISEEDLVLINASTGNVLSGVTWTHIHDPWDPNGYDALIRNTVVKDKTTGTGFDANISITGWQQNWVNVQPAPEDAYVWDDTAWGDLPYQLTSEAEAYVTAGKTYTLKLTVDNQMTTEKGVATDKSFTVTIDSGIEGDTDNTMLFKTYTIPANSTKTFTEEIPIGGDYQLGKVAIRIAYGSYVYSKNVTDDLAAGKITQEKYDEIVKAGYLLAPNTSEEVNLRGNISFAVELNGEIAEKPTVTPDTGNAETSGVSGTTNPESTIAAETSGVSNNNRFWNTFFGYNIGWFEGACGTLISETTNSWSVSMSYIGFGGVYGGHVAKDIYVIANTDYNLSFNIVCPDIDKWVFVEITDDSGNLLYGKWIQLKAGTISSVNENINLKSVGAKISFFFGGEFGNRATENDIYTLCPVVPNDGDANYTANIYCSGISLNKIKTSTESTETPNTDSQSTDNRHTPTTINDKTSANSDTTKGNTSFNTQKRPIIKNIKRKAHIATIKFRKTAGAKGYQVKYGINKKVTKKVKTMYVKKATFKIRKLNNSTKYYIKIRAYVLDGRKKIYSKWSNVKVIK